MAAVSKIDSNGTGLRIAEETSPKVLPGTPNWVPYEPNSYDNFGGEISTVARNPISASRQRKKGVVTDLDASGGFNTDLTQDNLQSLLQGFFFADLRTKVEKSVATTTSGAFTVDANGTDYKVGDLLFAKGFTIGDNNGLFTVSGTPTSTSVTVTGITASTTQTGTISKVGHQFGSGEVDIVAAARPYISRVSGTFDMTTLGLVPGEWVYIGGDLTAERFNTAANNGFARVISVTASTIVFDKTSALMVNETGTSKTIRIFIGRALKNETGTLIKARTYQLERTLGAPDDSNLSQIQSEYLVGAYANEVSFNIATADKVNVDMSFVAMDSETRTGVTGVKSGNRPSLVEADAFNTSSDFTRIRMSVVSAASAFPSSLFAYLTELTVSITNNVSPNKAIGTLGAIGVTAGTFAVSGSATAYFTSVDAIQAVKDNSSVTIDAHLVKNNKGITLDIPLLVLGDGRPNIEQDQAITLPLNIDAASAALLSTTTDYTAMMVFYDYLPNAAH